MYKLKSVKLWITAFAILSAGIFLWFGKVSDSIAADFIKWVIGFYTAGNVLSKYSVPSIPISGELEGQALCEIDPPAQQKGSSLRKRVKGFFCKD